MAHLWERALDAPECRQGRPVRFRFRGVRRVARILDEWRDRGAWWEGEEERHFFRVETADGGIFELCRGEESGRWLLYRTYD